MKQIEIENEKRLDNRLLPANSQEIPPFFIKPTDVSSCSTEKISTLTHNYHLHPLMQMDSLEALAKRLYPSGQCRFVKKGIKESSPFDHVGETEEGKSIEEVFQRIEEPESWIALYRVQTDPVYGQFVRDVFKSAEQLLGKEKMFEVQSFIFISSPPSVTPFHIDRENNFWLQIHGQKKLGLWDRNDRKTVPLKNVEHYIASTSLTDVVLKDEMLSRCMKFDCGPGDGVYFPSTTPHITSSENSWVKPGNGVCVSMAIVFYSDVTRKAAYIHSINNLMRKFTGIEPRPPQQSKFDFIKYPLGVLSVKLKKLLLNYQPPTGF